MQKPDKAPEPSMEEILASIRKIIAEEPIGTRPGPAMPPPGTDGPAAPSGTGEPTDSADAPPFALSTRDHPRSDEPPYSVEDALADLIEDTPLHHIRPGAGREDPAPKPHTQAASSPEDEGQRPSWLFARPGASPAARSPAPADPPAGGTRGTDSLLGQLDSMRRPPEAGIGEAAAPKPFGLQRPAVSGALFGREKGAEKPTAGDLAPQPPPSQPREPQRPEPSQASAASQRDEGKGHSAATRTGGDRAPAMAQRPATRAAEPVEDEVRVEPAEPAAASGPPRHADASPDALADSKPSSGPEVGSAVKQTHAPKFAAKTAGAGAEADKAGSELVGQAHASDAPASRTLEDTVADLLRPMLRDWLDSNMPRIVEKALRGELAASAKRPDGGEPPR